MTTLRPRHSRAPARRRPAGVPYINRELSWLDFNARVLHEARDERNPLLERAKFLAIFSSNLDEFFQVRVSGLMEQVEAGSAKRSPDGRTAGEQLAAIRERVRDLVMEHSQILRDVRGRLSHEGVAIVDYAEVPQHHAELRQRYLEEIFPVLTPLAVAAGHPFPYISTLTLSLAIVVRDPANGEQRFARVKVPQILPRLVPIGENAFVPLEQVIGANLDALFPGLEILESHPFRVTRDADFDVEEDEAGDLLSAIEEELRRRRFGSAVRLEVEDTIPPPVQDLILEGISLADDACYKVAGLLDATCLWALAALPRPDLKDPAWTPVVPHRLAQPDDEPVDVFAAIRQGDILVHHPYESFGASVERFIAQAASDPDVLSIKMTLYRTSGDSPIVRDLIRAADQGKQVVVLVEIKARFDEEANIVWARKLEKAGAHVVYGLVGLKTHSKIALVIRRETAGGLRRYLHLGTGNYNPKTARIYVDLGLLTCQPELGADATDLFNYLTGLSRQHTFRRLLVAPVTLRPRLRELIDREADHARAKREARIIVKCNAIVDAEMIDALYEASRAGVQVDCIVRGACSLHPGLEGTSERITVRSIVGEFLEHSRIYGFLNGGRQEWYTGSADLMDRNLDRRVEAVFPVDDIAAQARIAEIIEVMMRDDRRSWQLGPDARWRRTEEIVAAPGTVDTFATLKERALAALVEPEEPPKPGFQRASMDPRV